MAPYRLSAAGQPNSPGWRSPSSSWQSSGGKTACSRRACDTIDSRWHMMSRFSSPVSKSLRRMNKALAVAKTTTRYLFQVVVDDATTLHRRGEGVQHAADL